MKFSEFLFESKATTWYHGSNIKITEFNLDSLGSGSGADEYGPGIYLTNNKVDAMRYGKFIHTVEAKQIKSRLISASKNTIEGGIRILINKAPDKEDALTNWGENPNKAFNMALDSICNVNPKYLDALEAVWADFYNGESKAFLEIVTSTRFGYQGFERKADVNTTHFICWDPRILKITNIEEK